MEDEDYRNLVARLETEAFNQPAAFRAKVLMFSIAAYVVLFGLMFAFAGFSWWLFHVARSSGKTLIILGAAGWLVVVVPALFVTLRMFLMRLEPPVGRALTAAQAPQLFKLLEQLRRKLAAPPIHQVVVTPEFNAAIAQTPRFGLFGGHHNTLILGLPFLYAMAPREMMAVVAHEYGHLAGNHGKLGAWIYRQRRTFGRLQEHAQARREDDMVNGLFSTLLDTWAPYYNAYTFALSRQNEYEADHVASEFAGAPAIASGLIRSALLGEWLGGQFWPRLYAQAKQKPAPGFMPYTAIRRILGATMSEWATRDQLRRAWVVDSDVHDTHPCLRERVQAINQGNELPPAFSTSAADVFLGEHAAQIAREFDREWWAAEQANWQEHHRRAQRTIELEDRPLDSLSVIDLQEFAHLLMEFRSLAAAKPALACLMQRPGGPYAKPMYYYGRILLEENDAGGLTHLFKASLLSPALRDACAQAGYQWLEAKKGESAADRWLQELDEALEQQEA